MTLGYVLAAVICLDQAYRSVKQLKKYNRLIAYGIFKDHGLILPACILWLFNWHLFTYYAAEINKNAGKSLINIIRIITGVLVGRFGNSWHLRAGIWLF